MKVFFDTNILIDVLAIRQPFYQDSAALWTLATVCFGYGVVHTLGPGQG